jgi:hypothetical protein
MNIKPMTPKRNTYIKTYRENEPIRTHWYENYCVNVCCKLNTEVNYLSQGCPTLGLPDCVMQPSATFVNYVYMECKNSKVI